MRKMGVVLALPCALAFSLWGAVSIARAAPLGDLNCDGAVNPDDIGPFVVVLIDPGSYPYTCIENADMNGDGSAVGVDIQPFVDALLGPGPLPVIPAQLAGNSLAAYPYFE